MGKIRDLKELLQVILSIWEEEEGKKAKSKMEIETLEYDPEGPEYKEDSPSGTQDDEESVGKEETNV